MFQIRYRAAEADPYTTLVLAPGPTEVDYPERRLMKVRSTPDGAHVVQRPARDSRPRKWIWVGFKPTIVPYETQWDILKTLEYRYRLENALYPIVEVMEDVVEDGGFSAWVKVKFLRVERTVAKGPSDITYEQSFIEFVVEDTTFTGF